MEYFDVYSTGRERTGQILPRGTAIPDGCCDLVIFVCIFNSEGKMLIQQRQDTKKYWPGMWDVSVGGAVLAGETSLQAAIRETKEELGLNVCFPDQMPVMSIFYDNSIHDIWVTECDVPLESLQLQKEEVKDAAWVSEDEILRLMREGKFIGVYDEFIQLIFRMKKKRGILS